MERIPTEYMERQHKECSQTTKITPSTRIGGMHGDIRESLREHFLEDGPLFSDFLFLWNRSHRTNRTEPQKQEQRYEGNRCELNCFYCVSLKALPERTLEELISDPEQREKNRRCSDYNNNAS